MRVTVIKDVPGFVEYQCLTAGNEYDIDDAVAVSLALDGYVELERNTPAERAETAVAPRPPARRGKS